MASNTKIQWKRIVAEGVAIVASILIAFALDAAWDGRQERAQEREILAALSEEFEDNRVALGDAQSNAGQLIEDLALVLDLNPGELISMGEAELFALDRVLR